MYVSAVVVQISSHVQALSVHSRLLCPLPVLLLLTMVLFPLSLHARCHYVVEAVATRETAVISAAKITFAGPESNPSLLWLSALAKHYSPGAAHDFSGNGSRRLTSPLSFDCAAADLVLPLTASSAPQVVLPGRCTRDRWGLQLGRQGLGHVRGAHQRLG
jgi:hypothetical protein